MKKVIMFLSLISTLVFFTSCSMNLDKNTSNIHISKISFDEKKISLENIGSTNISLLTITDDYLLYSYDIEKSDTVDTVYCSYEFKSKKNKEICTVKNCTTSSGKYASVGNNVYFSTGVIDNNIEYILHCELDLINNKFNVIKKDKSFPPIVETYPLNNTEYVELQPEAEGDEYNYYINVGNSVGKIRNIHKTNSKDSYISCLCTKNNKIYTYEGHIIDGNFFNYLCQYNSKGELLRKYDLSELGTYLRSKDDFVGSMYINEDQFIFSTGSSGRFCYRAVNNKLEKVKNDFNTDLVCLETKSVLKEKQQPKLLKSLTSNMYYINNPTNNKKIEIDFKNDINYLIYNDHKIIYQSKDKNNYIIDLKEYIR